MLQWYQQTKQLTIIKNLKITNTFTHQDDTSLSDSLI